MPRPISDCAAAGGVAGTTVEPTDGGGVAVRVSAVLDDVLPGVSELDVDGVVLDEVSLVAADELDDDAEDGDDGLERTCGRRTLGR